ncbi:hypothetical protein IAU60_000254 [Kwoniella sp. DSM 27419]
MSYHYRYPSLAVEVQGEVQVTPVRQDPRDKDNMTYLIHPGRIIVTGRGSGTVHPSDFAGLTTHVVLLAESAREVYGVDGDHFSVSTMLIADTWTGEVEIPGLIVVCPRGPYRLLGTLILQGLLEREGYEAATISRARSPVFYLC